MKRKRESQMSREKAFKPVFSYTFNNNECTNSSELFPFSLSLSTYIHTRHMEWRRQGKGKHSMNTAKRNILTSL
jgi:hypothetical protein